MFVNISFHSVVVFSFCWFPLLYRSLLVWCNSSYLFFLLLPVFMFLTRPVLEHFPCVSFSCFIVSGFTFESLINFELIFIYGIWVWIYSCPCGYPLFPIPFIGEINVPRMYCCHSSLRLIDCIYMDLFLDLQFLLKWMWMTRGSKTIGWIWKKGKFTSSLGLTA